MRSSSSGFWARTRAIPAPKVAPEPRDPAVDARSRSRRNHHQTEPRAVLSGVVARLGLTSAQAQRILRGGRGSVSNGGEDEEQDHAEVQNEILCEELGFLRGVASEARRHHDLVRRGCHRRLERAAERASRRSAQVLGSRHCDGIDLADRVPSLSERTTLSTSDDSEIRSPTSIFTHSP